MQGNKVLNWLLSQCNSKHPSCRQKPILQYMAQPLDLTKHSTLTQHRTQRMNYLFITLERLRYGTCRTTSDTCSATKTQSLVNVSICCSIRILSHLYVGTYVGAIA